MSFTIQVKGLKEAQKFMTKFPDISKKHYSKAVTRSAQTLRDDTKKMPPVNASRTGYEAKGIPVAPKYGGTLRQSINTRQIALLAAGVFTNTDYGGFVHEGTRRMKARPFLEWALKDFGVQKKIDDLFDDASDRILKEAT